MTVKAPSIPRLAEFSQGYRGEVECFGVFLVRSRKILLLLLAVVSSKVSK